MLPLPYVRKLPATENEGGPASRDPVLLLLSVDRWALEHSLPEEGPSPPSCSLLWAQFC